MQKTLILSLMVLSLVGCQVTFQPPEYTQDSQQEIEIPNDTPPGSNAENSSNSPANSENENENENENGNGNGNGNGNEESTQGESSSNPPVNTDPDANYVYQSGSYRTTSAELLQKEVELTQSTLFQAVKHSISTLDNEAVERVQAHRNENPSNVKRVEQLVSEDQWNFLFPKRAPEYTYEGFLKAVAKFPAFCGDYDDGRSAENICRRSLATMFAHFAQETGGHTAHWEVPEWRQALVHVREMGWSETMLGGYNGECAPATWQGQTWPCGTFESGEYKSYFGRGSKQLSYNYNYGPFSEAIYGDVSVLLNNPEWVADTWLNLASAVFFFVYPQPPKPSMLHVIDGTWQPNANDTNNALSPGFGVTTQIINGGVECGGTAEHIQSQNRIDYYYNFAETLAVPIDSQEVLGCANMKQFDEGGSGALPIYWEQDWSWRSDTPDGASYQCQLVGYQTPFSALKEGDYERCVVHFFNLTKASN